MKFDLFLVSVWQTWIAFNSLISAVPVPVPEIKLDSKLGPKKDTIQLKAPFYSTPNPSNLLINIEY